MRVHELQRRGARNNPAYQTVVLDLRDAGVITKEVAEKMLTGNFDPPTTVAHTKATILNTKESVS